MLTIQPSQSLRTLILIPYFILLIAGLMIPSDGSHGFLNIKSLAYVSTIFTLFIYTLVNQKISVSQWKILLFLLCTAIFLSVWLLISLFYEETKPDSALDHLKIFWLTFSFVVVTLYLYHAGMVSFAKILRIVIYANVLYSCLKSCLVVLHLMGIINIWPILEALGVRFMSMDILLGLPRLQTSIDIATPFLLLFFLQAKQFGVNWSKKFTCFYLAISAFAIFLSFSRFLSFIAILSFLLHMMTLRSRDIMKAIPIFLIACSFGLAWIGLDNVNTIIENRFYSSGNIASDYDRFEQVNDLMNNYEKFPFFGKGLGGYATNAVRDDLLPYSYEVQWVAFLLQFGLVGVMILLIPVVFIGAKILSIPLTRSKAAFFILYVSWLLAGFTNPFLISLTSGIIYALFLLVGIAMSAKSVPCTIKAVN